jgi:hypothetical protein
MTAFQPGPLATLATGSDRRVVFGDFRASVAKRSGYVSVDISGPIAFGVTGERCPPPRGSATMQ